MRPAGGATTRRRPPGPPGAAATLALAVVLVATGPGPLLGAAPRTDPRREARARAAAPRPPGRPATRRVLARARGRFGPIYVVEEGGRRALRFGSAAAEDQSAYLPRRPRTEPLGYVSLALYALAWVPAPRRVLMIGLGGGSFLRHLRRLAPRARLEAVEIDPAVAPLARRWLGLRRARPVQVHLADGRRFLAGTRARYDVILLDAYDAEDYPAHLGTRELFALAAARLAPGGVVVANLSPNDDARRADLVATFGSALPGARCRLARRDGNAVVFGGAPVRARPRALAARPFRRLVQRHGGARGLFWGDGGPCRFSLARARILRDPGPPAAGAGPRGPDPRSPPRPR